MPDAFPPFLDASGVLAILAARCLDMPLSLSASYCFSFLTFADLDGMDALLSVGPRGEVPGAVVTEPPAARSAGLVAVT